MISCTCNTPAPAQPSLARRFAGAAQWAVPASVLALIPKCPACVAAYVAIGTGVAIPVSAASLLRTGMIAACFAALALLAARFIRRFIVPRYGERL